uniref:Protein kinase domain-containing protein n=1 Tax=Oryza barthii TaxID=65489 RepID=A0A0D3EZP1_9ORYZ
MEPAASELMDVHKKLLLASLSCVLLIQVASSDGTAEGVGTTSWTCMMMVAQDHGTAHVLLTKPLKKNTLQYMIGAASLPVTAHPEGKKHVSNKTVIVTLLVCVILTTIAFLGTTAYYLRRKDALSPHSHAYSFDKYTSWSSRSNLVSHRSSPLPQPKPKPRISVLKEFLCSCNPICGNEGGPLPGVIVRFSYSELEQATGKFSDEHLIGVGGTSKVYRGQLSDAKVIAVKKLRPLGGADEDFEFLSEVELLSRLNHCHVVPLLGYCMESQGRQLERLLVFECMGNGNLRDCLDLKQGRKAMDWATRVGVALGAARGVEYLHEAAAPRILHRDIKSTNILLDDKFRAKITDLGMAKCLMNDGVTSCSSSPARMLGTFGYFAPEYAIVGKASLKSDVFSFGVGRFPQEEMQIMAHLARECLQWEPESRPTMSEVVQILATIAPSSRKHAAAATLVTRIGRSSSAGDTMHSTRLAVKCSVGESWRSPEMEEETVVDLTEPRLEPAIFFN